MEEENSLNNLSLLNPIFCDKKQQSYYSNFLEEPEEGSSKSKKEKTQREYSKNYKEKKKTIINTGLNTSNLNIKKVI